MGKTCRVWQTDRNGRRATRETVAGHLLFTQKLGIRSRGRVESSPQSDRDRFRRQEGASYAGPVRGGKSYVPPTRTLSGTQGKRPDVDQNTCQAGTSSSCAKYSRKSWRLRDRRTDQ